MVGGRGAGGRRIGARALQRGGPNRSYTPEISSVCPSGSRKSKLLAACGTRFPHADSGFRVGVGKTAPSFLLADSRPVVSSVWRLGCKSKRWAGGSGAWLGAAARGSRLEGCPFAALLGGSVAPRQARTLHSAFPMEKPPAAFPKVVAAARGLAPGPRLTGSQIQTSKRSLEAGPCSTGRNPERQQREQQQLPRRRITRGGGDGGGQGRPGHRRRRGLQVSHARSGDLANGSRPCGTVGGRSKRTWTT